MQEAIEKRKEKLKHKIAIKPVFKSKSKEGIKERKEISAKAKTEKSKGQQKVKAGFIPPPIIRHEVESGKTNLPLFGYKQDTKISASEEKIESAVIEITVKREVKEHLKGSVEELVSEPQKLKNLSSEIKEPEVVIVKTDFEITPPTLTPETHPPAKPPEIKTMQFMPSTSKTDFDTAIPEIKSPTSIPLTIPKLSVEELPEIKTRNYFDNEVSSRVISEINVVEEVETKEEEITTAVGTLEEGETLGASGGEAEELFELFIKSSTGHFPKSLNAKEPLVIILSKSDDDNYASALQIICRELFHELIGGLPTSVIRSKGKKDIEDDLRAENRIEFIDDSKTKYFNSTFSKIKTSKEFENNVDWEEIGKRLNEFFTQGFGFVIFQIPEDFIQEFKRKLEEVTGDLKPQIMELSPQYVGHRLIDLAVSKEIDLIKLKRDISSAIWGFVIPKGDSRWSEGETFDNFFTACENAFYERLNKIGRTEIKVGDKKLPPSFLVNIGESERDLHYWIKVFIVKYLIEKKNYEKDAIKTEEDAKFSNSKERVVKPDIKVNSTVIEVETLYGTALEYHEPLNKVIETIRKYKDENFDVLIVFKNLDLFFYYKDLKRLKKSAKEEWNVDVKFFGLDLDKEELVPIDKFVKLVKLSIKTEGG